MTRAEAFPKVVELAMRRRLPREILKDLAGAVPIKTIYAILHEARAKGFQIPNFRSDVGEGTITPAVREILAPYAAARAIPVAVLARRILVRVGEDDLVGAILGDREESTAAAR